MNRLCMAIAFAAVVWPGSGNSSQLANKQLSEVLDLIQVLCITKGVQTQFSADSTMDLNSDVVIGTETTFETAFLITPDRRVEPLNKEKVSSSTEKREITLPNGRKLFGLVKIISKQNAWGQNKIAEDQAQKGAQCIKETLELDSVATKLPDYFNPSLVPAFAAEKLQDPNLRSDNDTISFLSDTRMQVVSSGMTILEPKLIRVRLYPPFLLNELVATLRAPVSIVPPYLDAPIKISAELIWSKALVQELLPAEQELRANPSNDRLRNGKLQN